MVGVVLIRIIALIINSGMPDGTIKRRLSGGLDDSLADKVEMKKRLL
ncbi:MAG: hypothetical protein ACREA8_10505 [Nitrosotalea sp.]